MNKLLITIFCMSLVFSASVNANNEVEYKKSIDNIAQEIHAISQNINANKKALKNEHDRLFETEKNLSNLRKSISLTENEIIATKTQNKQLSKQLETAKKSLKVNQKALSSLIESRYKNANPDYVKTLLNQENPYAVGRLSNYHKYFSDAFQVKITQAKAQVKEVDEINEQYETTLAQLEGQQKQYKQQQSALEASKSKRAKSIDKLNSKVTTSSEKVEQLQKNRSRLNSLLTKIAKQKEQLRKIEEQNKTPTKATRVLVKGGFIKQKGRLNYPVAGKHSRKFGSRLEKSGMKSEGIFISTNGNVSVKSIFRGRVIFAEFLKGYGLLLIIDHGDNHISLYGHNDALYKKVGDIVETNEVVALSGLTGGLKSAGLYFEIRNNASPVNPGTWCQ